MKVDSKRLVFVINNAAFFVSHRLPLALAAREAGWNVQLIIGQPGSKALEPTAEETLRAQGLPFQRLAFSTGIGTPWSEVRGFLQLIVALRRAKPTVVHAVTPKGILFGGLAARLVRVPGLVVAISGMGSLFTGSATGRRLMMRVVYERIFRIILRHRNANAIVQNADDEAMLHNLGVPPPHRVVLIPGSGVDLGLFVPAPGAERMVVLPARMLADKGVVEFVEAASELRARWPDWRFVLVGTADHANPSAISPARIEAWRRSGSIEWWGYRADMPEIYRRASIVCLPSYREGMPKSLLEAAAAGRAVVTTDTTGCREAIDEGVTGKLVPVGDAMALAAALDTLIGDPALRDRMGVAGRRRAIERFGIAAVVERTLAIYAELATERGDGSA